MSLDRITFRYELNPKDELDEYINMLKTQRKDLGNLPNFITIIGPMNSLIGPPYRDITIQNPMDFINRATTFVQAVPEITNGRFQYLLETILKIAYYAAQYIDYHYASSPSHSTKDPELAILLNGYSNILMKRAVELDDQKLPFRLYHMAESVLGSRATVHLHFHK